MEIVQIILDKSEVKSFFSFHLDKILFYLLLESSGAKKTCFLTIALGFCKLWTDDIETQRCNLQNYVSYLNQH